MENDALRGTDGMERASARTFGLGLSVDGAVSGVAADVAADTEEERTDRWRRWLSMLIAAVALILLAPVLAAIAVLVRATSPGPVFYTQTRVGVDRRRRAVDGGIERRRVDFGGRLFKIYKFRTMCADADRCGEVWARSCDPRVTRVGRFLRRYRLDELPQLINVLRGEMNIVGPRPEQPRIFVRLRRRIDLYPVRQRVLPGITGWAQINHHYDASLEDVRRKVQLDLEYLNRRSIGEDVRIMLRTLPVMVMGDGGW